MDIVMGYFKEKISRLIHGFYYNSDTYADHLRSLGAKIGRDCHLLPTQCNYR